MKFEDKVENVSNSVGEEKAVTSKENTIEDDSDEILLIEDEKEVDNDESDDTEFIFQQFLRNKQSGFKRTTPSAQPETNVTEFKCKSCTYVAKTSALLETHTKNSHGNERRKVRFCHYWNNFGSCQYESKTQRKCKFQHKTAPRCNFDGHCGRKFCMYTHTNQNFAFLVRPQPQQQMQAVFPSQVQYQAQNQFPPAQNQFLAQPQMQFPTQNQPQPRWQQPRRNVQRGTVQSQC